MIYYTDRFHQQVIYYGVTKVNLVFSVQSGEHQVQTKAVVYVLEGLLTDVKLGMDFFKCYNSSIGCIDSVVSMPCVVENDSAC